MWFLSFSGRVDFCLPFLQTTTWLSGNRALEVLFYNWSAASYSIKSAVYDHFSLVHQKSIVKGVAGGRNSFFFFLSAETLGSEKREHSKYFIIFQHICFIMLVFFILGSAISLDLSSEDIFNQSSPVNCRL